MDMQEIIPCILAALAVGAMLVETRIMAQLYGGSSELPAPTAESPSQ